MIDIEVDAGDLERLKMAVGDSLAEATIAAAGEIVARAQNNLRPMERDEHFAPSQRERRTSAQELMDSILIQVVSTDPLEVIIGPDEERGAVGAYLEHGTDHSQPTRWLSDAASPVIPTLARELSKELT